jgi:hypothetical protein
VMGVKQLRCGCRYGDEAGKIAQKGMGIAVDAYDVYGAYKNVRTKALAKAFVQGAISGPEAAAAGMPAQETMELEEGVQLVEPLSHSAVVLGTPPPGYAAGSNAPPSSLMPGVKPDSAMAHGATASPGSTQGPMGGAAPGAATAQSGTQAPPTGGMMSVGGMPSVGAAGVSGAPGAKPPHV